MMSSWNKNYIIFTQFCRNNRAQLVKTYCFVPAGVLLTLCVLYGVDRFIKNVIGVTFPASVAVMLINFAFMCILSSWRRPFAEFYIRIIDIPLSWSLRWMNLFFTPAFVTLPLSDWISLREAMLIVAVFVIGYMVTFVLLAYITILDQRIFGSRRFTSLFVRQEEMDNGMEAGSRFTRCSRSRTNSSSERRPSTDRSIRTFGGNFSEERSDMSILTDIASNSGLIPANSRTNSAHYSHTEGPLAQTLTSNSSPEAVQSQSYVRDRRDSIGVSGPIRRAEVQPPEPTYSSKIGLSAPDGDSRSNTPVLCQRAITRQFSQQVDCMMTINLWKNHLHHFLYGLGFFATIFAYYFSWYVMPFQFFTAVCAFMIIVNLPFKINPTLKKFLHPVICSVALTWIVILVSVMIKHHKVVYFLRDLQSYKTGRTYLHLFDNDRFAHHVWPGAGDVFSSCMDVSIVGLSMPMYAHRFDLRKHFLSMIPPILLLCAASLLLYPLICSRIGISSYMSIGFVGRSITLALGTPTVANLDGSITIMAVTTVISGVIGVLTGGPLLDLIGVPEDDYVTRGVTLGCNCGAIATAYLLGVDRRAAAISTLSFVLFGTFMVILTAVGKIKDFVQTLAQL